MRYSFSLNKISASQLCLLLPKNIKEERLDCVENETGTILFMNTMRGHNKVV